MYRTTLMSKRLVFLLFILLLGSGLVARAGEGESQAFQPGTLESSQVLPSDTTFLYANFSGIHQLLEDRKSLDLFKLWADEEIQAFFAPMKELVETKLSGAEGIDFPFKKVWSLFQGELTLACSSRLTIFERGAVPAPALLVDMGNSREQFLGTIDYLIGMVAQMQHLERDAFEYKGMKIKTLNMPWSRLAVCYTTLDNLFVATVNRYYLQEIIDTSINSKPALKSNPAFKRSCKKLGDDKLRCMAYVSLEPVLHMLEPFWPYEFDEWSDLLGLGPIESLSLGSACEGGGSRDSLFIGCPGEKKGLLKAFAPHPVTPQCLSMLPPETFFFMGFTFDPAMLLEEAEKFVRSALPEFSGHFDMAFQQLKRESGFDLREEILSPLGSEVSFFVLPQKSGLIPEFYLTVALRDSEGFKALLDKLLTFAPEEVKILETSYQGHTMQYLSPSEIPLPISPTFIIEEGRLVVSSTTLGMKKYLRWLGEGGPGLSDAFKKAMDGVPEGVSVLKYVNMPKLIAILYETGAPFLPMVMSETGLPLDPALLPMADTLTDCFSSSVSYVQADSDGYLLSGRWSFGLGALATAGASVADYLVQNDLVPGIFASAMRSQEMSRDHAMAQMADAIFEHGYACMSRGEYVEARGIFSNWLERFCGHENYYLTLMHRGYCNLALGKYEAGIADYKTVASESEFRKSTALYNICCGYSCLDRKADALLYLKKALAAGFDDKELIAKDSDLNNIRNEEEFTVLMELLK